MKEIWKNIEKEDGYKISPCGRVLNTKANKILLGQINHRGYRQVTINGKTHRIHKLVATAFIPNENNLPQINHKDCDKLNNHVSNLEWCTNSYNIRHAIKNGRYEKYHNSLKMKIIGTNIENKSKVKFNSLADSSKYGFSPGCISDCINGNRKQHKGYIWRVDKLAKVYPAAGSRIRK